MIRTNPVIDDWTHHASDRYTASAAWWTGRTVFSYDENQSAALSCAMPSTPCSLRSKTSAKNEAKASKLNELDSICVKPTGCLTKEVNIVEHDMSESLRSCVDACCELAKVKFPH